MCERRSNYRRCRRRNFCHLNPIRKNTRKHLLEYSQLEDFWKSNTADESQKQLPKEAVVALKKGAHLLKYGRRGKPMFCPFRLSAHAFAIRKRDVAALTLQKHYRTFRARSTATILARHDFCDSFSENGEKATVTDLCDATSTFLPGICFFFDSENDPDICRLASACKLFQNSTSRQELQVSQSWMETGEGLDMSKT